MSYDFTALVPEFVTDRAQVAALDRAMCEEILGPAPAVIVDFTEELTSRYFNDDDERFLMVDPSCDARGSTIATSWQTVAQNASTLLRMTYERGLLLYDPQYERLYDPRGSVEIGVRIGGGVQVPYLSESLLQEVFAHPSPQEPWLVISRRDQVFIQSFFPKGRAVTIEHRAGAPDQHYVAHIDDAELARRVLWQWATAHPGWETAVNWEPMAV